MTHPVPPTSASKKSTLLVISIIVILLLFFGLGGIALGKYLYGPKTIIPPPSSITATPPVTLSSPTSEPTADWKSYTIKALNLSFKLPPFFNTLGEMQENVNPGEKGTYLCMTFARNKTTFIDRAFAGGFYCNVYKFGLGTTSVDFEAGREAGFTDLQGYVFENGVYYAKLLGKKFDIPSDLVKKIENPNGIIIIRIMGKKSTDEEWQGPLAGTPGEGNIGALINTGNSTYPGLAVQMELNKDLTEDVFDRILSTFKFLD
jgi:hypothetical protein